MADLAGVNGQRKDFKIVGKPNVPGTLSWAHATGVAKFGADYVVPDMLHAKYLRSPYANARIKSMDVTKAKAIPGVVDVITWEDPDLGGTGGITDYADYESMEVGAMVIAENEDLCEEALRALVIDWEVFQHSVNIMEGRKSEAPVVRSFYTPPAPKAKGGGMTGGGFGGGAPKPAPDGMGGETVNPPKKGNVSYSFVSNNSGDVQAGFKEADQIIEYDINTAAFSGHIPSPLGTVAGWFDDPLNGEGKNLQIEGVPWGHGSVSVASGPRPPANKIFQNCLFTGGRYCDWGIRKTQQITPTLARRVGRPVRCVQSRADQYDFNLNDRYVHMKIGYKNNGLITAVEDYSIADNGSTGSSNFGTTMDQNYGPYYTIRCKNIKQNMETVDSNRGKMYLSGQHNPMGWDTLMTGIYLIAEKLGKNPIEIATLNLHGPESQDDPNPVPSYDACVAALKKDLNLGDWHAAGAKKLPDGRMHGTSFLYNQCPRHSFSGYNPKLEYRNGKVYLPTSGSHIGHYGIECNMMVIAEELGIDYNNVRAIYNNQEVYKPYGGGSDGSTASSWAVKECANKLKKMILETVIEEASNPSAGGGIGMGGFGGMGAKPAANPFKGLMPEALDIVDGRVIVKADPSQGMPLAQACRANLMAAESGIRPPFSVWTEGGRVLDAMNVAACEVAVDTETGEVEVLRFAVAADPGKILRRTSLEGQIHQVMDFTVGCQLTEEFIYDRNTGVKLGANMIEYKKVSMLDMPQVDMALLETRVSNACYGGSGISHSLANTHLVIMAIHNAIGKWVDSPATPEKVLKALGKA
ncbi:MAG: molybdopterin-dependent oxidoreductase [Acidobacteriota bacterium]|jgi:CO/xanthine dehydrogenase Mo-binding subunit|nr:molybdopterin-dependent oxidoreductase [Acidobacteriota bacterium]